MPIAIGTLRLPVKMCIASSLCTTIPLSLSEADLEKLFFGNAAKSAVQNPAIPVCRNFRRGC